MDERLLNAEAELLASIRIAPIKIALYLIEAQREYQAAISENEMKKKIAERQREEVKNLMEMRQRGKNADN